MPAPRIPALRRPRDPGLAVVLLAALLLSVAYGIWAWQRQRWYLTAGYDLGIFDQATRNLAHLRVPASSLREIPDLWGDHFHPIIVLWGALRAIWPSPVALLVSQAVLVSAAMVPLYLLARDRAGAVAGVFVALAYGTSWGVQRAIDFDVHELAFAPALLACAVLAADRRRWRWFWVSAVLLLCVKEDVSLLVVALGVWLVLEGERRHGAAAIVAGLVWFVLATRWWIPSLGVENFTYWTYSQFGGDAPSALGSAAIHPWRLVTVAIDPSVKLGTMAALVAPFLVVTPWLTRLAILPVPLFAERFLSDQPVYWGTEFHYSLLPMMALAIASAGGIATVRRQLQRRAERSGARPRWSVAARRAPAVLAGLGLVVGTIAWYPVYDHLDGPNAAPLASLASFHGPPRTVDRLALDRLVAAVPHTGSVAAPRRIQPHLTGRGQPIHILESRLSGIGHVPHVLTDDNVLVDLVNPTTDVVSQRKLYGEVVADTDARLARGGLVGVWGDPSGWVVLRSPHAPGGAPVSPALGVLTGAPATAARAAADAWGRALRATAADCTISCDAAPQARLDAAARTLDRAMQTAAASSPGSCGPILRGVGPSASDLLARRAAITADPGSAAAQVRYQDALDGRLSGAVRRALMVCAPGDGPPGRGLPDPPSGPGSTD